MSVRLTGAYAAALGQPDAGRLLLARMIIQVASGMAGLSLLLTSHQATNSYAVAGLVAGAYAVGLAVAAPITGRIADSPRVVRLLGVAAALHAVGLGGFVLAVTMGCETWVMIVLSALRGAATPPMSSIVGRRWMQLDQPRIPQALFAASSVSGEATFLLGPLLVSCVTAVASPEHALALTVCCTVTGVLLSLGPLLRASSPGPIMSSQTLARERDSAPEQLAVLSVVVQGAVGIGALQVSLIAFANSADVAAGILLSLVATTRGLARPLRRRHGVLSSEPALVPALVLVVVIGASNGPADALETLLLGAAAAPQRRARAFGLLVTANWVGFAIGTAAAGALAERSGVDAALLLGVTAAAAAAVAALGRAITRRPPPRFMCRRRTSMSATATQLPAAARNDPHTPPG